MEATFISTLLGHTSAVYAMVGHGDLLYTTGGDGNVVAWPMVPNADGTLVARVGTQVFSMAFLPSQGQMLLGQMQGGIHVVDVNEKKEVRHLALHTKGVFGIMPIENTFLAAGGDGVLSMWQAGSCQLVRQVSLAEQSLRCMAYSPSAQLLAVGSSDNGIYLLHYPSLRIVKRLEGHTNSVFSVCFSADGKHLLSGSRDAHLMVWDVANHFENLHRIAAHLFTINHIVYSPCGKWVATAGRDKDVKIWDASTFTLKKVLDRHKFPGHINSVNVLHWGQNYLASAGDDRTVKLWQID